MLLGDELDAAARHAATTTALAFGERSWTFAQWNRASLALAARVSRAVAPGGRVAVLATNHPTVALALSAVPRAGRVLSLPNWRLHPAEIADVLLDVDAALVIGTDDLVAPVMSRLAERGSTPLRWDLSGIDELLEDHPNHDEPAGAEPVAVGGAAVGEAGPQPDDPAWIIHTSGTTGTPKGVVLTHASLLAGATTALFGRPVGATDTYLYPFPLCHVSAHNVLALHLARRSVVLAERFEPGLFWDQTRRWNVSMASLAPTMLAMLLDDPSTSSVPPGTLRAIGYGASAITPELLTEASRRLGCEFSGGYGMTEASGNAVFLDAASHRHALVDAPSLLSSVGFPGPLTRVRITPIPGHDPSVGPLAAQVGTAPGAEVGTDEVGQIELAGPQVAAGYWNRPEDTIATFGADGWLRTGDLGRLDTDGRLWVTDRLKDLVISGGENVSAREVELVLAAHPAVKAVAVVGSPDPRWGEVVTAVVVPRPGHAVDPAELQAHVRASLAPFKVPKRVQLVDVLPQNATGKVDKVALRASITAN